MSRHPYTLILRTELLCVWRHRSEMSNPLVFFLLVCTLYPLAVSPESSVLQNLAPGVIWVSALLATLLSLEGLFRSDFEDGTLEQLFLGPRSVYFLVMIKVLSRWLAIGLPLILLSPLLAVMLFVPNDLIPVLVLSLFLGTPLLMLIGAIGVALVLTAREGGVLLSLLILPFYMPILIFGSSATYSAMQGFSPAAELLWLSAMLVLAVVFAPLAIAGALRMSLANG